VIGSRRDHFDNIVTSTRHECVFSFVVRREGCLVWHW